MAVNVQAKAFGGAQFGLGNGGDGNGSALSNLTGVYSLGQPAFWSVALAIALGVVIAVVALSAWEKI